LEVLYRAKWNAEDGLGALVISPTRELAVQIFEVLKKIGKQHMLSAGLIIGGKDLAVEQDWWQLLVDCCNIWIRQLALIAITFKFWVRQLSNPHQMKTFIHSNFYQ
jgi:hypothetical protein